METTSLGPDATPEFAGDLEEQPVSEVLPGLLELLSFLSQACH